VFEAYNFTDSGVGSYNLVPDSGFYFVDEKDEVGVIHADIAKSYTAQVDGPTLAVARADEPASDGLTKRASYVGCPNPRRLILRRAAASAEIYARNAKSYLTIRRGSTPRFTTWFGRFTPAHRATVLDHFNRIDANTFSQFTYDCTCTRPSTYAFVFANTSVVLSTFHFESRSHDCHSFGRIHLCGAFWRAPLTGTDSQVCREFPKLIRGCFPYHPTTRPERSSMRHLTSLGTEEPATMPTDKQPLGDSRYPTPTVQYSMPTLMSILPRTPLLERSDGDTRLISHLKYACIIGHCSTEMF